MDCLGGWVNETKQKLNFSSHIMVLGPLNGAQMGINYGQTGGGQKYKINNFEASNAFEVL